MNIRRGIALSSFLIFGALFGGVPAFAATTTPAGVVSPIPPDFIKNVHTRADFEKLTPAQQQEALNFMHLHGATTSPAYRAFATSTEELSNTVACATYRHLGSVQAVVNPTVASTVSGVPLTFTGSVTNNNTYPIVDGQVYAKIFKKGSASSQGGANGYPVVAEFLVENNISVPAGSSTPITFTWQVPAYASSGQYEISTYVTTSQQFNLLGELDSDSLLGSVADFGISGEQKTGVVFDKNEVLIGGMPYHFAAYPMVLASTTAPTVSATLTNTTATNQIVTVASTLYKNSSLLAANELDQATTTVTVPAHGTKIVTYNASKAVGTRSVVKMVAAYHDTQSILNIPFIRGAQPALPMLTFMGLAQYPLVAGKQNTIFSCLQADRPALVKGNTLTLTLKDALGNTIHSYTYTGSVPSREIGVASTFTPRQAYASVSLTATLAHNGQTIDSVTKTYDCAALNPGAACPVETSGLPLSTKTLMIMDGLFFALLLLVGGAFFLVKRRKAPQEQNPTIPN